MYWHYRYLRNELRRESEKSKRNFPVIVPLLRFSTWRNVKSNDVYIIRKKKQSRRISEHKNKMVTNFFFRNRSNSTIWKIEKPNESRFDANAETAEMKSRPWKEEVVKLLCKWNDNRLQNENGFIIITAQMCLIYVQLGNGLQFYCHFISVEWFMRNKSILAIRRCFESMENWYVPLNCIKLERR